jgi:hypothetical protein
MRNARQQFTAILFTLTIGLAAVAASHAARQDKPHKLGQEDAIELARRLDKLIAYGNAGDWENYTSLLFLSRSEESRARLIAHHRRYFPEGFRCAMHDVQVIDAVFDETGTWPAEWSVRFSYQCGEAGEANRAYTYAGKSDGDWYFVEPSLEIHDGRVGGSPQADVPW